MLMPALGTLIPLLKGASAEEAVPFPGRDPLTIALCQYYRRNTHFEGASFEPAAGKPATANAFREPPTKIPHVDHDFDVNKIPCTLVVEGRGAQDMVALEPSGRIW
jgi:hypothetical protein